MRKDKHPPIPEVATPPKQDIDSGKRPPAPLGDNSQQAPTTESHSSHPSQPQEMEVHHHTHTARKKFKHYAFEFFMLFLAVFCGFLAEYQLEHVIEKEREKQYMASLVRDLQVDTTEINNNIEGLSSLVSTYDTLLGLLHNIDPNKRANELYYHFFPTITYWLFRPSNRTIDQLKGAGFMRLIRNMNVSDSITDYYNYVEYYQITEQTFKDQFYRYHDDAYQVFDYKTADPYANDPELKGLLNANTPALKLASYDKTLHIPMYNKLSLIRVVAKQNIIYLIDLKRKATSTIQFLKKEYQL
jgi:hypothetical protein